MPTGLSLMAGCWVLLMYRDTRSFFLTCWAGVGGIDHALLVVACDDGVMAQTREHLAILQLTGNPQLTVALTKADRVDESRLNAVRETVQATLREYGFADAPLFVTVATEGRGIDELRHHLQRLTSREHASHHRFRLAIDRAFTVKGAGLVVTGTALSGEVNVGDTLWLTGANAPMRVRGLHAQNQPVEHAHAGQRIALNIAGDAEKEKLNRGDWLLAGVPPEPSERAIVALQTHVPLTQWQPLHIHHAASHITGACHCWKTTLPNWFSIRHCGSRIMTVWYCVTFRPGDAGRGAGGHAQPGRVAASASRSICNGWERWRRPRMIKPRCLFILSAVPSI